MYHAEHVDPWVSSVRAPKSGVRRSGAPKTARVQSCRYLAPLARPSRRGRPEGPPIRCATRGRPARRMRIGVGRGARAHSWGAPNGKDAANSTRARPDAANQLVREAPVMPRQHPGINSSRSLVIGGRILSTRPQLDRGENIVAGSTDPHRRYASRDSRSRRRGCITHASYAPTPCPRSRSTHGGRSLAG